MYALTLGWILHIRWNCLSEKKGQFLYHAFVMSPFIYCSPSWMFCGKTQNKEIDRVHKRALRILLEDQTPSFDELLLKIGDVRVHVKNLHNLMIEIHKCLSCENSSFIWNIFERKELTSTLTSGSSLMLSKVKATVLGI